MKAKYAEKRALEAELNPPEPEPELGRMHETHYPYEIRRIEQETHLVHAGWTDVGGPFQDESFDKRAWRVVSEEADAGPRMQVPVFLSRATLAELDRRERGR